jgi:hypothetical protein
MTDIVDQYKDNTNIEVNYLTQDEFDEEWKKLFPLGDKGFPEALREQSE